MYRLVILPESYIYPQEHRAVRDLLCHRLEFIKHLLKGIEKRVKVQVKVRKEFKVLSTIPGIGDILGLIRFRRIGSRRYRALF